MKDLPQRKNIWLRDYDYSSNGAYFITLCVKDRQELLGKINVGCDAHIAPPTIEFWEPLKMDGGCILWRQGKCINVGCSTSHRTQQYGGVGEVGEVGGFRF